MHVGDSISALAPGSTELFRESHLTWRIELNVG